MKKILTTIVTLASLTACNNSNGHSDSLTLAYLDAKIYPDAAINCRVKFITGREIIGCKAIALKGNSNLHLYNYSNGKFYALNGTARQIVETYFSNRDDILLADLPLPNDIDISNILSELN